MLRQLPHWREKKFMHFLKRGFLFPEAHDVPKSLMIDRLPRGQLLPEQLPHSPWSQTNKKCHQRHKATQWELSLPAFKEKPRKHRSETVPCEAMGSMVSTRLATSSWQRARPRDWDIMVHLPLFIWAPSDF